MAKLGKDTDFIGTDYADTRPRVFITEEEVEILASDQASVYQSVLGKDLDDGSLTGAAIHVHDGTDGALLPIPLSYVHNRAGYDTGNFYGGDNQAFNPQILTADISSSVERRVVYHWPVFAPAGCTAVRVYVRGNEFLRELGPLLCVDSTVGQWDTWYPPQYDDPTNPRVFYFDATLTGGAVNYLTLLITQPWLGGGTAAIYQIDVCPLLWRSAATTEPDPGVTVVSGARTGVVHTATYLPIQDTFTKDGKPLSSYVTGRLAANNAYLHELITDTAAPGYGAAHASQVAGHWHDGGTSAAIDVALYSECFGCATVAAAGINGLTTSEQSNLGAPYLNIPSGAIEAETYYTVRHAVIAVPDKSGATTWTGKYTCVVYIATTSQVKIKLYSGNEPNTTDNNVESSTVTGPGYFQVSGDVTLNDSGLCYLRLDAQIAVQEYNPAIPGTYDLVSITGLCVYLT